MKRNLSQVAAFAVGTGAQAAIGFITVPILVRVIGVEQLGVWAVLEAVFQFSAQVALLGFNQTLIKFIAADGLGPWRSLCVVFRKVAPFVLAVAAVAGVAVTWAMSLGALACATLALLVVCEAWIVLSLSAARAALMGFAFSSALVCRAGLVLAGVLMLRKLSEHGAEAGAQTLAVVWVSVYLAVAGYLARSIRRRGLRGLAPNQAQLAAGFAYGLPLLGTLVLAQTLQYSDRFLVSSGLGFPAAGQYVLHAKLANAMAFVSIPVQLWWPSARFIHLKDEDGGQAFFKNASVAGFVGFGALAVCLAAIVRLAWQFFAPQAVFDGGLFLLLLLGAYVQCCAVFINVGLLQEGATHWNLVVWGAAACVQLTCQVVFMKFFGSAGVAGGLLAGSVSALVIQYWLSQRVLQVGFPRLGLVAIGGGVSALLTIMLL